MANPSDGKFSAGRIDHWNDVRLQHSDLALAAGLTK
jgi:hypothetical protein